jgi:hypothetical protein
MFALCLLYPLITDIAQHEWQVSIGPQGDIGLAYSITSSAVTRSEGEIVPLFQKRLSFNVLRDGWWVSDVWVRLTVACHRVYGWYRPRIPWIKAATLSTFCSIAV